MNWAVLRNSPLKPLVSLASKVAKRVRRLWGRDITAMPVLACLLSLISLIVSINQSGLLNDFDTQLSSAQKGCACP